MDSIHCYPLLLFGKDGYNKRQHENQKNADHYQKQKKTSWQKTNVETRK